MHDVIMKIIPTLILIIIYVIAKCFIRIVKYVRAKHENTVIENDVENIACVDDEYIHDVEHIKSIIFDEIGKTEMLFKNVAKSGAIKKDSVLKSIHLACVSEGIEYDETAVSDIIDKMVEVMKKVN